MDSVRSDYLGRLQIWIQMNFYPNPEGPIANNMDSNIIVVTYDVECRRWEKDRKNNEI